VGWLLFLQEQIKVIIIKANQCGLLRLFPPLGAARNKVSRFQVRTTLATVGNGWQS